MDDLPEPLSASKLKKFDRCPEAFRIKYIEGKPEEGTESIHLKVGDAVHESIETVLKEGISLDDEGLLRDRFRAEYRRNDYGIDDESAEDKVYGCLSTAAKFLADRDLTITGIEVPVRFVMDTDEVTHPASGYIDITTESRVIDWKTGTSEDKGLKETLQGAVYMAGFYAMFGEPPTAVQFVYLDEGKVRTFEPSDTAWGRMVEEAEALMQAVEDDFYPAKPEDSKCYHCGYEVHCTTSDLGAGNIDWRSYP